MKIHAVYAIGFPPSYQTISSTDHFSFELTGDILPDYLPDEAIHETDSDGEKPGYEECIGDSCDLDVDGVVDSEDNCPSLFNPTQDDTNDNGIGDACDGDGEEPSEHPLTPTCPRHQRWDPSTQECKDILPPVATDNQDLETTTTNHAPIPSPPIHEADKNIDPVLMHDPDIRPNDSILLK